MLCRCFARVGSGIAESALEFALAASEESHPNEYMECFAARTRAKLGLDEDGTVLTDVLVIPGTESNPVSATVKTNMVPNDLRSAGRSTPPERCSPAERRRPGDVRQGKVHIIIGAPYGWDDWQAFDRDGEPIDLRVLNVDPPEEAFFDFDQADIDAELREDEW